ncbi:MAG: hypothetical protein DME22_02615 [Verrucomicrobia bacterium]|nr:MAG: hypothetical protein DME22_02615 [Verrucomicrobiota bacterium]PYJ96929.1 MAG: hypothetical protein DME23_18110 [Verrucomicrobiota bacterium]
MADQTNQSSVRSGIEADVAPTELVFLFGWMNYKDAAPMALSFRWNICAGGRGAALLAGALDRTRTEVSCRVAEARRLTVRLARTCPP